MSDINPCIQFEYTNPSPADLIDGALVYNTAVGIIEKGGVLYIENDAKDLLISAGKMIDGPYGIIIHTDAAVPQVIQFNDVSALVSAFIIIVGLNAALDSVFNYYAYSED